MPGIRSCQRSSAVANAISGDKKTTGSSPVAPRCNAFGSRRYADETTKLSILRVSSLISAGQSILAALTKHSRVSFTAAQ
jgi:hypothetical protein